MNPIAALLEKPWLTPGLDMATAGSAEEPPGGWDRGIGLGLFLLVVTVVFALLTMAYMMRMGHGLPGDAQDWRTMREPPLLWVNSAILAASSLAFLAAERSGRAGDGAGVRRELVLGGLLGVAFLAGQLLLWSRLGEWRYALLYSAGLCRVGDAPFTFPFPSTILGNPALAFFYLISGLHGLHVAGGLIAWVITSRHVFASTGTTAAGARAVQLCARYWHFLLLVWALMMGLFVAT
jgi:cytochrome c oxidase subunit 3